MKTTDIKARNLRPGHVLERFGHWVTVLSARRRVHPLGYDAVCVEHELGMVWYVPDAIVEVQKR